MAKQTGEYKITGTYDDVTYYKMEGQYYARKKSSLRGERVKRDKRFRRTMEWAQRLGRGSQLASKVYRSLTKEKQVYALFTELKSRAILALKEGRSETEVVELLKAFAAAGGGVYGNAQPVVGAMKKPQAIALKAGVEYRHLAVSREGQLVYGGKSYTLYALRYTDDRQVMAVNNPMGKGPPGRSKGRVITWVEDY